MAKPMATVAKQVFRDFRTEQIVSPNYSSSLAMSRALRIFLFSFAGYEDICPQLFQQKLSEYIKQMQTLYGIQNFDQSMIGQQMRSLSSERIHITIGVKMFTGRRLVINPKIIINNGVKQSQPIPLDTKEIVQKNVLFSDYITFDELKRNKIEGKDVVIHLGADHWKMGWSQLKDFIISYRQIPAEGFENWFYFGRGVRLLIKIGFQIDERIDHKISAKFHLHSIIYMIRNRLKVLRDSQLIIPIHRPFSRKSKVTYIRKEVEPNRENAFWSVPYSPHQILDTIQSTVIGGNQSDYSSIREILKNSVKFNDLQIGYQLNDYFEDNVCLCNEWCNWNAFFHYNPIYRFLLVQNNQLCLRSRTNIAELYLFAPIFCAYETGLNIQQNQRFPETPVLRLISCANDYRTRIYQKHYLKDKNFKNEYNVSYPDPRFMNGLSYNLLRNDINLPQLWLQSDADPLSDNSIENITDFYRLFGQLHIWCTTRTSLIAKTDIKKWFKELDLISRQKYRTYFKLSYDKRIAAKLTSFAHLFTEDYEYANRLTVKEIKLIRAHVIKMGVNDNPFNIRVIFNDFLSTFASIYKFIKMVEPTLPQTKSKASCEDVFICFKTFDTDFNGLANNLNFDFKFDEQMIGRRNLDQMREVLTIFFTLRLYFMASGIQNECINSLLKVKKKVKMRNDQISNEFNFIWRYKHIEQKLRNDFPKTRLYVINTNIETSFDAFYVNYWGSADHELHFDPQIQPNIDSALFQYKRLYFWWRNGGNTKLKFTTFMNSMFGGLRDIVKKTEDIHSTHILTSMLYLSQRNDYYIEVLDVLVLYLLRSASYMMFATIATFMRKVHTLQVPALVNVHFSYSLSKPGWVPLLRTIKQVKVFIDRLNTLYIVYEDEFDKISNTLTQMSRMVKEIYRDYYKKLSTNFLQEINKISRLPSRNANSTAFISIHLSVGFSFITAFIDEFRPNSRFFRKFLEKLLYFQSPDPHQTILNNYIAVCDDYLATPTLLRRATPLLWSEWQQDITSVDWNDWNRMTEQQLKLDLNAANS